MTGGLVQEFSHAVLPDIKPLTTIILTAIMIFPALIKLWTLNKNAVNFLRAVVLCALTSFLFGWHVHEKAILMAIIPLSILSILEFNDARIFLILCTTGHYSLFPLLHPNSLLFIKVLLILLHSIYTFHSLSKIYPTAVCRYSFPLLNCLESLYILGFIPLFLYNNVIHKLFKFDHYLPFLPLMLTSVYCSIGVAYCWLRYYAHFMKENKDVYIKFNKCN